MKLPLHGAMGALATTFLLLGTAGLPLASAQGQDPQAESPPQRGALDRLVGRIAADERDTLMRASEILKRRGFTDQARQVRRIANTGTRSAAAAGTAEDRLEGRARALLRRDIQSRPTRIDMLELIAEGYRRAEQPERAAAMRWFAEVGRVGESDGAREMPPMPEFLQRQSSPLMDRLTWIVAEGARVQREAGRRATAEVSAALARFYRERAAGERRDPQLAQEEAPEPEPEAGTSVQDLVTIEARVPILNLAAEAYSSLGDLAENEELVAGRRRMAWMAATGRNRLTDDPEPLPPIGTVPNGMDTFIQDIQRAARLWRRKGDLKAATECATLAEYYRLRDRGEIDDESRLQPRTAAEPKAADMPLERRAQIERLEALRAEIERLRVEIEALGKGRR